MSVVATAPRTRHRVLLVDDDRTLCRIHAANLELGGFAVFSVPDSQSALDILDVTVPDVIVLDCEASTSQPIDGISLTRAIRKHPAAAHTPIIVLTSRETTDELIRGFEAGADDYLIKPFGPAEMLARVRAKIRRSAADASLQPLTKLPGNLTIEAQIAQRFEQQRPWAVLYLDLDNFKAFNDVYGFVRGDEAIVQLAAILTDAVRAAKSEDDFVGHIGGDDFIVVTVPERARAIADTVRTRFDREIVGLYTSEDAKRGYIETHDRRGAMRRFPIMSISIAIVSSERRTIGSYQEIGEIAAELKKYAKSFSGSIVVGDKRT